MGMSCTVYKIRLRKKKNLQLTSMLGSSCRNSCLVLISSPPIFARLHLDQWVWTRHWFPPKWWSLSWTHPKVIPAKTAKVGSAQNPGRPGHEMWLTIKRRGLWPKGKKCNNIEYIVKVRQIRNGFFKPTIPPKNERMNSVFLPDSTKNEFVRSFFGGNRGYQKDLSKLSDL